MDDGPTDHCTKQINQFGKIDYIQTFVYNSVEGVHSSLWRQLELLRALHTCPEYGVDIFSTQICLSWKDERLPLKACLDKWLQSRHSLRVCS